MTTKTKNKIGVLSQIHAEKLASCAEYFKVSKRRMIQIALKYAYGVDSIKKSPRGREEIKVVRYFKIDFSDDQYEYLEYALNEVLGLSFPDLMRRSADKLHTDLYRHQKTREIERFIKMYS